MSEEVRITIFIVLCLLLAVLFGALFFFRPLRKLYYHRRPKEFFYRKVYDVTRNGDYFLLNDLSITLGNKQTATIDHLMGGDKFIYVFMDFYCEGALSASPSDSKWIYYRKDGKKLEIQNPLVVARDVLVRLTMQTGINSSFLVGIVLINDDCFVNAFENHEGDVQLIPLSKLQKVIDSYESRALAPFAPKELRQVIHDLYEIKGKKEKE